MEGATNQAGHAATYGPFQKDDIVLVVPGLILIMPGWEIYSHGGFVGRILGLYYANNTYRDYVVLPTDQKGETCVIAEDRLRLVARVGMTPWQYLENCQKAEAIFGEWRAALMNWSV